VLAELEGDVKGRLLADGLPEAEIAVTAALDCRYVGQGYELRVPLPERRFSEAALARFHELHQQEYGHAHSDPIEIVNLRVTAIGSRPKLGRPLATPGTFADASLGDRDGVFRIEGRLETLPTRMFERSLLPIDSDLTGPCIVFQRDTTVLVPPSWVVRASASGNLLLTKKGV
jgi:N-methylhydantoinase A